MDKKQGFQLNAASGYFQNQGVDVMAFDDIYPEGHQSGISVIMHGNRVATNGDIRFEQTPGQWQPVPKQTSRELDEEANTLKAALSFPNTARHLKGFNPMIYPDFAFDYTVTVKGAGASVIVTVDLSEPIPERFVGKMCFNLELFPGALRGKPWIMDDQQGIFPAQPNGPTLAMPSNYGHVGDFAEPDAKATVEHLTGGNTGFSPFVADDIIAAPYAVGKRFTARPDDPYNRLTIEAIGENAVLKLYDGRMNHNNGWFVISGEVPAGATKNAIQWAITPNAVADWRYTPVVQVSQVGYHPNQTKTAVIELDGRVTEREQPALYKITETGAVQVLAAAGVEWGRFLRYQYLKFDFTGVTEAGLYQIRYGASASAIFRIAEDVYDRGVWQPVLEYFLPVQMCHMRVTEKYRVWHDHCHADDARMAPVNHNHFDGYVQGPSTLTKYKPGDVVPGLNVGGWHDAGDDDLRIDSQATEAYILSLTYEAFDVQYDATTIDQVAQITEIHQPDGKNDILQQIEHGALSVVGAYRALGRLYRGIICSVMRRYVTLGDPASQTDGVIGNDDDRWVFTEHNPGRELTAAAHLAGIARALRHFNDTLSTQALEAAKAIFAVTEGIDEGDNKRARAAIAKIHAAAELYLTTGEQTYKDFLLSKTAFIVDAIDRVGWFIGRVEKAMQDPGFTAAVRGALPALRARLAERCAETPYGVPYRPHIWGAGWDIQRQAYQYYFLYQSYPDIFDAEMIFNALHFVLGCHPGSNTMSFVSGVGAESPLAAFGFNRGDWSHIPGGVISGTALIRPDLPELLVFPHLWQQTEYVLGGGSSHYMFLVLAAQRILKGAKA